MSEGDFLSRWSRRKHEARRSEEGVVPAAPGVVPAMPAVVPAEAGTQALDPRLRGDDDRKAPLPPVESLTPESDFAPFMQADVDADVRRSALKTLFGDPRFNVMDGLDVYIDDYSKPDPLPEGWLEKLNQAAYLGHYQPKVEEVAPDVPAAGAVAETEAAETIASPGEAEEPGSPAKPQEPAAQDGDKR